jgi:ABC-2 type transport system permease protein
MNQVTLLLSPRWKKFRNTLRQPGKERIRYPFLLCLVLGLWACIFLAFVKALAYFTAEEMFGTVAATKLLSMILVTFAFVAVISNLITTFSTFFLSEDLELVMSAPVSGPSLYTSRFLETLLDASWMVLVFGFPVFMAYGKVFSAGWSFYAVSLVSFACLLVLVTAAGIAIVHTLVRTFPIRKLRDLFVLVAVVMFIAVYLLVRMIRPEELLNPQGFASVMDYLSLMSESSSPLLPTTWIVEALRPYITGYGYEHIPLYVGIIVFGAAAAFRLVGHYHEAIYFQAYSKAMESKGARLTGNRFVTWFSRVLHRWLDPPTVGLVTKELLLMVRDWGRLSQLLLLLALIVVYLYNFSVLPSLENPEATMLLRNGVAFMNIGLAGFVLASLGVRFLFPAISSEGRSFWILKGSPVALRRVVWVKFVFYLVPMLVLGLFLVVATNHMLGLGFFISAISTVTVVLLTIGITSLSIGMGVVHADLHLTDPNRAFSGFGGLITMIYAGLSVAAIILLEAFPVYRIVTAPYFDRALGTRDYAIIAACFCGAVAVAIFLIVKPLRVALHRIDDLEV